MENNDNNPGFQGGSIHGQGQNANDGNHPDSPNTKDLVDNTSNKESSSIEFPKNGSRENEGYAEKEPTEPGSKAQSNQDSNEANQDGSVVNENERAEQANIGEVGGGRGDDKAQGKGTTGNEAGNQVS